MNAMNGSSPSMSPSCASEFSKSFSSSAGFLTKKTRRDAEETRRRALEVASVSHARTEANGRERFVYTRGGPGESRVETRARFDAGKPLRVSERRARPTRVGRRGGVKKNTSNPLLFNNPTPLSDRRIQGRK